MPYMEQKPNLFVVGSAKCGTTTVARVLGEHPDCCMSDPKETFYFCKDGDLAPWTDYYRNCWRHYKGEPILAEASTSYSEVPRFPDCSERIVAFNPDAKIVYIVRHPFDKIVSYYRHQGTYHGFVSRDGFEQWLKFECSTNGFYEQCKYSTQLRRYQRLFPADRILVLFLENWKQDPAAQIEKLFAFAGLRPVPVAPLTRLRENSATDHRAQKEWFWRMRHNPVTRKLGRAVMPTRARFLAGRWIGSRPAMTVPLTLSARLTNEFIDEVKPDADRFAEEFAADAPNWDWTTPPWKVV